MPRRPRPIPPDPDGMNERRAGQAEAAIGAFEQVTGTDADDRESAVCDLLCNLKHWCDRHNTSFYQELRRAEQHYREETAEPLPF